LIKGYGTELDITTGGRFNRDGGLRKSMR
jgi:hypothetical protein